MANVKSSTKSTKKSTKKSTAKPKIKCTGDCKKELAYDNFYVTKSPLFPNGRFPICKKCIKNNMDYDNLETVYPILRSADIPFFIDYWEKAESSNRDTFGEYLRMANSLPQFNGLTYEDSIFPIDRKNFNEVKESEEEKDKDKRKRLQKRKDRFDFSEEELDDMIDKWGFGYSNEEYYFFEKKYKELVGGYNTLTERHIEALKVYVRYRIKADLATAKGDVIEADKWGRLADKASEKAKLNPNQLTKMDLSGGLDNFGEIFRAVEEANDGVLDILPKFLEVPQDDIDATILSYVNYVRRLLNLPDANYKDIYSFYETRKKEIEESGSDLGDEEDE